jgi:excisionase family DNA binding protein
MTGIDPNVLYTVSEATRLLKMHRQTVYRKIWKGLLKSQQDADGRHRIWGHELLRLLNSNGAVWH